MKTKGMPEKIYLLDYNDAMVTPLEGDTVYVREDAFIDKACDWLRNSTYGYLTEKWGDTDIDREELVKDFKKAMKL
jgi:aminoglycoside/choline kinase family phosphotransferase